MNTLVMALAMFLQIQGMDLPVERPVRGDAPKVSPAPVVVPETPQELESPPVFYGQVINEVGSLCYVIDCSGSMGMDPEVWFTDLNGAIRQGNRMERARAEIVRSIESLPSTIKFSIIAYNSIIWGWRPGLQPANKSNKQDAEAWVINLQPTGMTATGPAVVVALDLKPQVILLLTDGEPNIPVSGLWGPGGSQLELNWHRFLIRDTNKGRTAINVYGINANGALRQFCVDVASDNRGTYIDAK